MFADKPDRFASPESLSPEARAMYERHPDPLWLRIGDHYILDDDLQAVNVPMIEWSIWFERNRNERIIRRSHVGVYLISTVFLGLDHNFGFGGPPVLWETMIFDERDNRRWADVAPAQSQWRYCSTAEAVAGHDRAVAYVNLFRRGPRKLKKFLRRPYDAAGSRVIARRYRHTLETFNV